MLLHSIFWYFCFAVTLMFQTPRLWIAKRKKATLSEQEYNSYVNRVASRWALGNAKRSGGKFHFEGMENIPQDRAAVFVANHQGDFDIAVILAYFNIPHGYIAKIEILKVPLLRDWMKNMQCVFIDRKNIRQTAKAIMEGVKILQNGHSLVLFPEGTRSKSDEMGEFKAASFKLATKAQVPIVPISISGTYKLMEANNRLIKPANVYIKIHPPIETTNLEEPTKLPEQVREIIKNGLVIE